MQIEIVITQAEIRIAKLILEAEHRNTATVRSSVPRSADRGLIEADQLQRNGNGHAGFPGSRDPDLIEPSVRFVDSLVMLN
jgi:hypothetical protein